MARRPDLAPRPGLSRQEMESIQDEVAGAATFTDDFAFDPNDVCSGPLDRAGSDAADRQQDLPVVVGVDQSFLDGRAISAIVAMRGGEVMERTHAVSDLELPYVPGLLSFREGGPILEAFETLSVDPDVAMFDGSGRIHFREAGLATHMGVVLDLPSLGVAKNLLCGTPRGSVEGLREGDRVPIEAGEDMTAPDGTVVGYALQSRQYDSPNRHVNPLYVSPGHRVAPETAADVALGCCAGYKLPEPTRRADAYADELKETV